MATTHEEIDQLLANLKLTRMREIVQRELQRLAKTGCAADEMLARLLREQWNFQQERRIHNRIDSAEIPEPWELDTFPWAKQPGVNQSQIKTLASLDFVANGSNLVLLGDIGVGKTAIATGCCSKRCEMVTPGDSSRLRCCLTTCTRVLPTVRRLIFWTSWRGSRCF